MIVETTIMIEPATATEQNINRTSGGGLAHARRGEGVPHARSGARDSQRAGNAAVESMQFHRTHHRLRCTSPAGEVDAVVASNEPMPAIGDQGFVRVRGPVWALEGA